MTFYGFDTTGRFDINIGPDEKEGLRGIGPLFRSHRWDKQAIFETLERAAKKLVAEQSE